MPKGVPYFFRENFCLCATVSLSHRYHPTHIVMGRPERSHSEKGHREHRTHKKRESREFYFPALPDLSNGPPE